MVRSVCAFPVGHSHGRIGHGDAENHPCAPYAALHVASFLLWCFNANFHYHFLFHTADFVPKSKVAPVAKVIPTLLN